MGRGAPKPKNEAERLAALQSCGIMDTPPEPAFDEIAALAGQIVGTPIAFVGLIDGQRQWFKARVGLGMTSVPRANSICAFGLDSPELMIIRDAREDERFRDLSVVTTDPRVRFYAGAPLRTAEGLNLGTLCCIDRVPRTLPREKVAALATLSRQVTAQLELRRALKRARQAQEQLVQLECQRDELVGLVVHDLKNPISAVMGWSELLLLEKQVPGNVRGTAFRIARSARTMNRMVLDLLDIRRSEEGTLRLNPTRTPIEPLVEAAIETLQMRIEEREQRVVAERTLAGQAVYVDAEAMRRVIENLLENCVKYGKQGGVVRVGCALTSPDRLELCIADDGPGIPAADRERIFEKYIRLEGEARDRRSDSYGLGLVFCRLAVEASGGSIRVEANKPRGAAFYVQLPLG